MATSAKLTNFQIGNSTNVLTDISSHTDTADLDQKLAALDATVFGNNAKAFVPGLSDGSVSIGGTWDSTVDATIQGAQQALISGSQTSISWQYAPQGTATGNVKYSGNCIITDYKSSGSVAAIVKWTATLQVTGPITRGTF